VFSIRFNVDRATMRADDLSSDVSAESETVTLAVSARLERFEDAR
jgi:hypothetical protein